MDKLCVALYWDFENLHAALYEEKRGGGAYGKQDNRFTPQDALIDVQAIVDFSASYGDIAINRAYCNWQWFSRYRHALLENAVELVQLFPPGASAKNGADIKLSLDATEDVVRMPHIGTIVIVGGDSDFIPLAQKVRAAGRSLVGVGTKASTNIHWANSCTEFRYYEALLMEDEDSPDDESDELGVSEAKRIVVKAIRRLAQNRGDRWVVKARVRPMVKRLAPTFDEENYGCRTFTEFLDRHPETFAVRQGEHDHEVCVVDETVS
jgi:uncharacterized protein (TIGR00288 family)